MRKILLILSLASLTFVFLACSSKEPSALEKRVQKHISFQGVKKQIVKEFNYKTNSNGLLEFELVLLSEDELKLSYQISWKDEDGFTLKTYQDGVFKDITLKENQEFLIQRVASNKDASDFRIILSEK
ncbi:DUF1425 domain-containing protein [Campylobacter sp. MIT 97-5078]|uniref:DUF1425 domain-containing protein n=1 Tax=Campylobacter sp. MIT 97-5078 TaxID=1548153 RepID=UPI000512A721|nr:DUF1425 domain-containing protein [Campylobacter sp. MIT 97-5078]KGI56310.1 hypothetical protein LR59_07745 [Campylobacter sp. MIT 97-5078]KGI57561.1 hypothetical protein LR59_02395 [Campylobacter sp. MIT 97-5078]KGI57742.1 hypothetical protein LR59_03420 [Campylobacter sp. MIT 97-5078]TQR26915.1 DUF1425 domain-containing protein [Campylobacter sp. MIT 97-5078]